MFSRFNKTLVALAVLAGATAGAHAEGLYVGGSVGAPDYSSTVNGVGGGGGGSGIGLKLYGGYRLTPNFAVEGGYFNLGRSKDVGGTAKAQGLYVDGVGSYEFAPKWSLLGSVGVADGRLKTNAGNDSSPALKLGVGLEYALGETTALRVTYDRYRFTSAFDGKPEIGQALIGVKVGF